MGMDAPSELFRLNPCGVLKCNENLGGYTIAIRNNLETLADWTHSGSESFIYKMP